MPYTPSALYSSYSIHRRATYCDGDGGGIECFCCLCSIRVNGYRKTEETQDKNSLNKWKGNQCEWSDRFMPGKHASILVLARKDSIHFRLHCRSVPLCACVCVWMCACASARVSVCMWFYAKYPLKAIESVEHMDSIEINISFFFCFESKRIHWRQLAPCDKNQQQIYTKLPLLHTFRPTAYRTVIQIRVGAFCWHRNCVRPSAIKYSIVSIQLIDVWFDCIKLLFR